jgi:hypothetical protein
MTITATARPTTQPVAGDDYQAGVCNIGPAEIARRRRTGHVGTAATLGLLAVLVTADAPPVARLLAALPATVAASGYLQARLKFCAGYGSLGVFNVGGAGEIQPVTDPEARARDRRRSRQIGLGSFAIGAAVGLLAWALPV